MRSRLRAAALAVASLVLLAWGLPARAQLVGTDTAPGDSCSGFAQGATRMTADADHDGGSVVLICDGTIWQATGSGSGDNLGDHTATQNVELNGHWLSGDGGNEGITVDSTGLVGVGTASPTAALQVNGDIKFSGVITDTSDIRLKTDIVPLGPSLAKVTALRPISFRMKDKPSHTEFGFAAQDVEKIYPELVVTADDDMKSLSLNYIGLIAPMTQAITELNAKADRLAAENARIKAAQRRTERELATLAADMQALKVGASLKVRASAICAPSPETTAAP